MMAELIDHIANLGIVQCTSIYDRPQFFLKGQGKSPMQRLGRGFPHTQPHPFFPIQLHR